MEKVVEVVRHSNPLQAEAGDTQAKEDHAGGEQPPWSHPFSAQHQHNEATGQESQHTEQNKEQHEEDCECWVQAGPSSGHHPVPWCLASCLPPSTVPLSVSPGDMRRTLRLCI